MQTRQATVGWTKPHRRRAANCFGAARALSRAMDDEALARQFETNRAHLRAVAGRMLSSRSEAEDAVQETWLRLSRADTSAVENLSGWLTAVVSRVCLDMLRARKSRAEQAESLEAPEAVADSDDARSPERKALVADTVSLALLVVLETLTPTERLSFVLHDLFDLPFDEIASIVGCSPAAARQLASRARRRVQGTPPAVDANLARHREVVEAFLAASRTGDVAALLGALAPDVVLRADPAALAASAANQGKGAPKLAPETRGAASVADAFAGRAGGARPAFIDGQLGTAWTVGGKPRAIFQLTFRGGVIASIAVIADPEHIRRLEVVVLDVDRADAGTR